MLRDFFSSLLCLLISLCLSQTVAAQELGRGFDGGSPFKLAEPLQWQVLPEGTVRSPQDFRDTAKEQGFTVLTSGVSLPTEAGKEVWLRFALPETTSAQTWYLRIPRLRLDQATVYFLDEQNRWGSQTAGVNVAVTQWPVPTRLPSFQLTTRTDRVQVYFLKLQNRTPITELPELITPIEYIVAASLTGGMVGLMLGLFGLLILLSLLTALLYRNHHFAWFALYIASLLVTQLVLIGFAGQRIWPHSIYLNQIMYWVTSLWTLAACLWFMMQISYARQTFPRIYQASLGWIFVLVLTSIAFAALHQSFPREAMTAITGLGTLWGFCILVWMAWRAQSWLWLIAAGFAPLSLAMLTRLAYNFGWVAQAEVAQLWSVIAGTLGMIVIYASLIIRNRDTFAAMQREAALSHTDLETGLTSAHMTTSRLPRVLARSARSGQACGVVMLQWTEFSKMLEPLPAAQKDLVLAQLGTRLRRLSRYIDTVARLDDDHFLFIVESPITRDYLIALATKILTACMRPVSQFKNGAAFNVHIALWINADKPLIAQTVLESLRTRLNQMGHGTSRRVQFVDSPTSVRPLDSQMDDSGLQRAQNVLAKIKALEADPAAPAPTLASVSSAAASTSSKH
jgi:two-component system, sensor histidine kinase LadS